MKSILIILSTIILSCHLHAQEKKINDSSMQENWNIAFDKEKLEMLYPGSDFKESPLAGIWVEIDGKTDTLIFYPYFDGKEPIVNLKRGLNTDNKLPRQYSGPYHYRLEKGVIKTQWFLSSTISYPSCFFQMAADSSQLKIGNFYRPSDQIEDTLVFRRIDN